MKVFFLSADKPICKHYELVNNQLVKHPYPFVYEVKSYACNLNTLQEFTDEIRAHAALGHCLLKGTLTEPLYNESRASKTDPEAFTDWICLDLDGIQGYETVDAFLKDIGCDGVDYILQWSSSMGIENQLGLRCHVFMKLSRMYPARFLKTWLLGLNLTTPNIASQIQLTKTNNSLRWPLDVTTCQNDKLIYITPPILDSKIPDPFPDDKRITFQARGKQVLEITKVFDKTHIRQLCDTKVNDLRTALNLPKRKATKFKELHGIEYMADPGEALITGIKEERDFVYLNLNGGDSWGYYHPKDNPNFIYNFKGEPTYRTEELLPGYWRKLRAIEKKEKANFSVDPNGITYFAFRDFSSSNYYNGWYDPTTKTLNYAQAKSETQLRQFMEQHGRELGPYVPDWNLIWQPSSTFIVDPILKKLNTFQASRFMLSSPSSNKPPVLSSAFPTIEKVIQHISGYDAATYDHLINWLACVAQHRTKTGTAWIFHGTQGTGKGVLFHHIITPIFGEQNVVAKRMEEIESEFTGFMENKFFVFLDEMETGRSLYHSKVTAKLKNLIVEPMISIRKMYNPAYMAENFANMIFASNKQAVEIAPDDRRFNVAPYQNQPIKLTAHEVDDLIPAELQAFYDYLMQYPADLVRARTPLISQARANLIEISKTAIDGVTEALNKGDLAFFWDFMLEAQEAANLNGIQANKYRPFRDLMIDLVQNQTPILTRSDLLTICDWCIGDMPNSPHKFSSLLKHHRILLTQVWKNGRNSRGMNVSWSINPQLLATYQQEIANGLV
jgi:hypothetical protein